jgi:hypothetical protein
MGSLNNPYKWGLTDLFKVATLQKKLRWKMKSNKK